MDRNFAQHDQVLELRARMVRHCPEDELPSDKVQHLIDNPPLLKELLQNMVMSVSINQKIKDGTMTKSDWQKLFGHLRRWDKDFNEKLYLLGSDDNTKAEEFGFDRTISGHEAVQEFERMKRKDASLWAQGRYINDNPNAQKEHSLVGTGARRRIPRYGYGWFPVFLVGGVGVPVVDLCNLGRHFDPICRFLLQVED